MKIGCFADTHGTLDFRVDPCDLLVIAGDLCEGTTNELFSAMKQPNWLNVEFRYWLADQPVKECVMIAGNHDWCYQLNPNMIPKMNKNLTYLQDEEAEVLGLKVYGTPRQPIFLDWAFNHSDQMLELYYQKIPEGLDILITHSPPFKIFDKVTHKDFSKHVGSKVLKRHILRAMPRIVVCGHCHGQYGIMEKDGIVYVSCSVKDEKYRRIRKPLYLEIQEDGQITW